MKSFAILILLALAALCPLSAYGATVYVSQSGGTVNCGVNGAQSTTAIASVTWTAGNTYNLCATFTGTANSTMITIGASGSSGSPITVFFENNAVLTAPYWASSVGGTSAGAITCGSHSWIVINGNSNFGIIENSANGSGLADQKASTGISCFGSNNIIENLTIENLYVQISPSASLGDDSTVRAIDVTGQNVTIQGNILHDCGWCVFDSYNASDTNLQVLNNQIYHMGHGVAFAAASAVSCSSPCLIMTGNLIHDAANWSSTGCAFHQDGLHLFGTTGSTMDGVTVANNQFYGDWGTCPTGFIFAESGGSDPGLKSFNLYNNLGIVVNTSFVNTNGWIDFASGHSGTQQMMNNTIIGNGQNDNTLCLTAQNMSALLLENNTVSGCGDPIRIDSSTLSGGVDYNFYGANTCQNSGNCFIWNGSFKGSFSAWKSACSCDSHAISTLTPDLNSDGTPQSGFLGIAAGVNLSSLSITALDSDLNSSARPASSAWTIGAFNYGSAPPPPPPPAPAPGMFSELFLFNLQ